jgi:hypothetical protein
MYDQQFTRVPNKKGEKVCGLSRAKIYEISERYPKIFRRLDGCTLIDTKYLNQVISQCPAGRKVRAA